MALSSDSLYSCANILCGKAIDVPRPGWRFDNDHNVNLCDICYVAFYTKQFCDIYHENTNHWSFCQYCGKKIHVGCIVSQNWFKRLETGGIICSRCSTVLEASLVGDNQISEANANSGAPLDLEHDESRSIPSSEAKAQVKGSRGKYQRKNVKHRYKPRVTKQELKEILKCSNVEVTPLFEKMLTASDTRRNGRLVVPKKCAEDYFPSCDDSDGKRIVIQDSKGKDWDFKFKFWPNFKSKIYILEGFYPYVKSMKLRVGDMVCFGRLNPDGKLVMGCKKFSPASSSSRVSASRRCTIPSSSKKVKLSKFAATKKRARNGNKVLKQVQEARELEQTPSGSKVPSITAKGIKIGSNKGMVNERSNSKGKACTSATEVDLTSEGSKEVLPSPLCNNVPSDVENEEVEIMSIEAMLNAICSDDVIKGKTTSAKDSKTNKRKSKNPTSLHQYSEGQRKCGESVENKNKRSNVDLTSKHDQELEINDFMRIVTARSPNKVLKSKTTSPKHSAFSKGKSKCPEDVQLGAKRKYCRVDKFSKHSQEKLKAPASVQSYGVKDRIPADANNKSLELGSSGKNTIDENKRLNVDLTSKHDQQLEHSPFGSNVGIKCFKDVATTSTNEVLKGTTMSNKHSINSKGKSKDLTSVQLGAKRTYSRIDRIFERRQEKQKSRVSVESNDAKGKLLVDAKSKSFEHGQGSKNTENQNKRLDVHLTSQHEKELECSPCDRTVEIKGFKEIATARSANEVLMGKSAMTNNSMLSKSKIEDLASSQSIDKSKYSHIDKLSKFSQDIKGPKSVHFSDEITRVHVDAQKTTCLIGGSGVSNKVDLNTIHTKEGVFSPCDSNVEISGFKGMVTAGNTNEVSKGKTTLNSTLSNVEFKEPLCVQSEGKKKYIQFGTFSTYIEEKQKGPTRVQPNNEKDRVFFDAKRRRSDFTGYVGKSMQDENKRLKVDLTSKDAQVLVSSPFSSNFDIKACKDKAVVGRPTTDSKHAESEEEMSARMLKNISLEMGQASSYKQQNGNVEPKPQKLVETTFTLFKNLEALPASHMPIEKQPHYRPVCIEPPSRSKHDSSCQCRACAILRNYGNMNSSYPQPEPVTRTILRPFEEGNYNLSNQMIMGTQTRIFQKPVAPLSFNPNHQMMINSQQVNSQKKTEPGCSKASQNSTSVNGGSKDKHKEKWLSGSEPQILLYDLNFPPAEDGDFMG